MNRTAWAAAALAVVLAAGCTSSDKPSPGPVGASSASTPSTTASTATSPAPSPSRAKPLSPFEHDPAVSAFRTWAAQVARTINEGKINDADLSALMTPSLSKSMRVLTGGEIGHAYPGPLPFTPTRVTVTSATRRDLRLCVVDDGFSLNPKTHKPFARRHVQPIDAGAALSNGRWLVSKFDGASFSCAGVKIAEPSW